MKKSTFLHLVIAWTFFALCGNLAWGEEYSVTLPPITIHYITDKSEMPEACGEAPGCVVWSLDTDGRSEHLYILAEKSEHGICPHVYHVLGHEIQHIVSRTDEIFIDPDIHQGGLPICGDAQWQRIISECKLRQIRETVKRIKEWEKANEENQVKSGVSDEAEWWVMQYCPELLDR